MINKDFDTRLNSLSKTIIKYGKYIEDLEKEVAILKANSHPKRNFVVCENCKCNIKEK